MENVKKFLLNWWTVTITIVVLLLGLLVIALPIFVPLLRPWWVRLLMALAILLPWGIWAYFRWKKGREAADAIARQLALAQEGGQESVELAKRMTDAIAAFKTQAGNKRDYLYSRPWYVIIGPPGAGKTTALLNSGLRFPFAEQALKGVGGTRNLDFWFADEAVLVDTAGRYTSQDSNLAADSKAWGSFLGLLKKNRPLQPINGVLVAIGVDEIIKADQIGLDHHAATVRRRLSEIRDQLEMSVPVYVLFTKLDLIPGFAEYFEDLDVEGRRAVFGITLPYSPDKPLADTLAAAFDEVAQAAADRQAKRLADEPDPRRRALLLGFPAEFMALRARIVRFLEGAFITKDAPVGALRGFYATSGVQQGAPLERLLAGMGEVYDAPQSPQQGRAYFLNRLLAEVVFPEAGLVSMSPAARFRQKSRMMMIMGGMAAACALVLIMWSISLTGNLGLQGKLLKQASAAGQQVHDSGIDLVEVGPNDADLEQAVDVLDSLRALDRGYAARQKSGTPFFMAWGLFQKGHSDRADLTYRNALRRIMLPRLMLRLEDTMRENMANPLAVYEPLKAYLMLGGQKPGKLDKAAIKNWVTADWETTSYPGADRADLRKRLTEHLDALLDDKDMAAVWPKRTAPLDAQLIADARADIGRMTLADRAYAILRQSPEANAGNDWLASAKMQAGDAVAFGNGDDVLAMKVPYFFTRVGFEKAYQPGLVTIQKQLQDDLWVLGPDADSESAKAQMSGIRPGVAGAYATEYIAHWDKVLATMQPADFFNDPQALSMFTSGASPYKRVLLEVRTHTNFSGGTTGAVAAIQRNVVNGMGSVTRGAIGTSGGQIDAGTEIQGHFSAVQEFVGDGKAPAPIDVFLAQMREVSNGAKTSQSLGASGGGSVQEELAKARVKLEEAGQMAPAQLQGFVGAAVRGGAAAQTSAASGAVSAAYATNILPTCQSASKDKYPFFSGAQADLSTLDAMRTFGAGGTLDGFVQQRLAVLMDTSGPVWRWKADDPVASTLNPASADEMARLAQIRDLLSGGIAYKVSVASFGPEVNGVEFSSGGTSYVFNAANMAQPKQMMWTLQGVPEAHISLTKDGQAVDSLVGEGPWALFRLMEKGKKENSGPTAFQATFGQGGKTVKLNIQLSTTFNPFSRGGLWTFRCPVTL